MLLCRTLDWDYGVRVKFLLNSSKDFERDFIAYYIP